ncbi:MAG: hypothetical protein Q8R37_00240 [Nanoarchaeota archaeon]|nr:hypothetical protein [Nanoarchaeota archaeon]
MAEDLESMMAEYKVMCDHLKKAEQEYYCGDFGYIAEVLVPRQRADELNRSILRNSPKGLELRAKEWQRWIPVLGGLRNQQDSERNTNNLYTIYGSTYMAVNRLYNIAMEGAVMATPLLSLLD